MGMGGGATEGMGTALLARIFPGQERFVVGVSQAGYCFGAVLGTLVMGIFLPLGVSWRVFFIPVAALALANFVLFATSRYPPNEHAQQAAGPMPPLPLHHMRQTRSACCAGRRAAVVRHHLPLRAGRNRFGQLREPVSVRAPRCTRAGCIQAIGWFWAIMLVGRLLCSILPATLADRKLIAGAMLSGATAILLTIPLPGWPGAGSNPGGLVPDGRNLANHRGHDGARQRRPGECRGGDHGGSRIGGLHPRPPIMGWLFDLIPPALAMAAPACRCWLVGCRGGCATPASRTARTAATISARR